MSLHSIEINNFQSHKKSVINLSPGVNAIVGASDSGKSAIVRAILWAITNKPGGSSFGSKWGGETSVSVATDNDVITRTKGKENKYCLTDTETKKEIKFKAFGASVPDEINAALNIGDINIQKQMDSHFLLSSSPGEVGRVINKAVKIDIIDKSLKNVSSSLNNEKNKLSTIQKNISEKENELKCYDWLNKAEKHISCLEDTERKTIDLRLSLGVLNDTIDNINNNNLLLTNKIVVMCNENKIKNLMELNIDVNNSGNQQIIIDLQNVINEINSNDLFLQNKNSIIDNNFKIKELIQLNNDANVIDEQINNLGHVLQEVEINEIKIQKAGNNINSIEQIQTLIEVSSFIEKLTPKYNLIADCLDDLDSIGKKLLSKRKNVEKMSEMFSDMIGDTCPLCGARTEE